MTPDSTTMAALAAARFGAVEHRGPARHLACAPLTADDARTLLVDNLALVEQVVGICGRRGHLAPDQVDRLRVHVQRRLQEDDCAVLRRFEGRSSLRTYLVTVVHRLVLDCRTAERGR